MPDDRADRPNTVPWPPLLYVGCAVLGIVLDRVLPLPWPVDGALTPPGLTLMAAALGLDVWAMLTMSRQRANILPHRAATALVTSGPFAWSRNPIYLGNTLLLAGAAFAFASPWLLPMAALAAALVTRLAIRREEAHLAARFGPAWAAYCATTARWIGRSASRITT